MAVVVKSGSATSVAANTTSANQVSGTYQFIGPGKVTLIAKSSATGMFCTLLVGGIALVQDQAIMFTGTAGTLSSMDNIVASQAVRGGQVEFYLRNSTAGALTTDYLILFDQGR